MAKDEGSKKTPSQKPPPKPPDPRINIRAQIPKQKDRRPQDRKK